MEKLLQILDKLNLAQEAREVYQDMYNLGPWENDAEREAWVSGFGEWAEATLATRPAEEVTKFVELEAQRLKSAIVGDATSHQTALNGLRSIVKPA